MSLFSLMADLSGVAAEIHACWSELCRIADALERLSPPLSPLPVPAPSLEDPAAPPFTMAESGAEYESRKTEEREIALLYGVLPDSPAARLALEDYRREIRLLAAKEREANGNQEEITNREVEDILEQSIRQAAAQANGRTDKTAGKA